MKRSILICFLLVAQAAWPYTPKEGNVSAVLGPVAFRTDMSDAKFKTPMPALGGVGLLAYGDIGDHGSLEIAMFYMQKIYVVNQDNRVFAEKSQVMHIPMGYRYWWAPSFSTSLAIYSSYPMGNATEVTNDYGASTPRTSLAERTTYGAEVAVQIELREWDRYALVSDVRYAHAFDPKPNESSDHAGVFLGLRYFIQAKQIRTRE